MAFKELAFTKGPDKLTFFIYKISEDKSSVIVEETSLDKEHDAFIQNLTSSVEQGGSRTPHYAVYDVEECDLNDDGRRYDFP